MTIRSGEKGPISVDAMAVRVRTRLGQWLGLEERPVMMWPVEAEPAIHYALSDAAADVPLEELIRARFARHKIEEVFEAAKGEVGLAQCEVRGWVGWHRHVTLSLLALWFLCCERRRVGGKTRAVTVPQVLKVFTRLLRDPLPGPERIATEVTRASEEGSGPDLSLAQADRQIPAA